MDNAVKTSMMNNVALLRRVPEDTSVDEFHSLFAATYPSVVRTVWFVVHDHEVAEEVAQDAFIELHRHWAKVGSYDQPALWVRRVAIRKAQREAARAAKRSRLERAATGPMLVDDAPQLPDRELLDAIRTLPPRQRAVLVLFYLEDRPMEEVADLVGCSTSTGFVQLHQARRRLAALLTEEVDRDVR